MTVFAVMTMSTMRAVSVIFMSTAFCVIGMVIVVVIVSAAALMVGMAVGVSVCALSVV